MEDDLDRIAAGNEERSDWLRRFYFGERRRRRALKELVSDLGDIDARAINTIEIGNGIELRVGRYGPYIERDGQRSTISDEIAPDELTVERAEELLAQGSEQRDARHRPRDRPHGRRQERPLRPVRDRGRRERREAAHGVALQVDVARDGDARGGAAACSSLPRIVGIDPADGEEIVVANGRYGPFVKRGADTRSLESEEQLLTLTLDEALALLAQPKQRGRRAAAAAPLRELGDDPVSGKPMVVKNGRFGPYVTDGETNASLRSGDDVETLTYERAVELMAARRERGPAKPQRREPKPVNPGSPWRGTVAPARGYSR